ncbi:hypothetical protein DFP72DRAFT_805518 [Ephemerocybe angulata]|uniref:Uncharacterized protein n=1 Tax=Ephemerocybe angulata TaxID=980116 RepID=A0A8H6I9U2_9AGAR|nr:hypothetical protein DFP72DRAFT_805518 [Tulosesus angulatus]
MGYGTDADDWTTTSKTPTRSLDPEAKPSSIHSRKQEFQGGRVEDASPVEPIMSADVVAIAQLQASMKTALQGLASAFDHIDKSTKLMNQLALEIKEREQLASLREDLERQITSQKEELEDLKTTLESKIKQTAAEVIKTQLDKMIQDSVSSVIEGRVRRELSPQVPDHLRQSASNHERQMFEVQADLHNAEARRYNASLQSVSLSVPLRPLLRPVPTPEQSPYPILLTSAMDPTPERMSGFPLPHVAMPIRRSTSNAPSAISRSQSLQSVASTASASALFPKDLKSLFALDSGSTKTLLREYGLQSAMSSPAVDDGKPKAHRLPSQSHSPVAQRPPSPVIEESEMNGDIDAHVEDMNTFMSHIGVPFLMVPPPKSKETNADRRRKLAPLIINKSSFR